VDGFLSEKKRRERGKKREKEREKRREKERKRFEKMTFDAIMHDVLYHRIDREQIKTIE
jgi:hypothetical protein